LYARNTSPLTEVLAGTLAGACEAFTVHPLDSLKTQFHVRSGSGSVSILAELTRQTRQGGLASLYRGVIPAMVRPQCLVMYVANENSKRLVAGKEGSLTWATAVGAGLLSGLPEAIAVNPFEVVKVRMQALEHRGRFRSSIECLQYLWRKEGLGSLYRGIDATIGRNCIFNGAFFGSIHIFKDQFKLEEGPATNLALGTAGGFIATCVKQPFDVAKSRIQNTLRAASSASTPSDQAYNNIFQAIPKIYRQEGVAGLYKGFVITYARMSIGQGVALMVFEETINLLRSLSHE